MTTTITYLQSFTYLSDPDSGKIFPGMWVSVAPFGKGDRSVETIAQLDTGAEFSVFDGELLVPRLGLNLMDGPELTLASSGGFSITARIHRVEIIHPDLGRFALDAAISTVPIRRNLLGRDFFQHIQIGFREFRHNFMINAAP